MASSDRSTTQSTSRKRLARAKIKHPETEGQGGSSKATKGSVAPGASKSTKARVSASSARSLEAARAEDRKSTLTKWAIGAFAVLMALSMMVPSLAYIVSNSRNASEVSEAATEAATTSEDETTEEDAAATEAEDATPEDAADGEDESATSSIDASYAAELTSLEEKLAADENNLAALLNLGKLYMSWGYSVSYSSATDAETQHANDLFNTAIGYFDRYLALHDSNAVKVDRALCQLYQGDVTGAQAALTQLTEEAPDYGPAWANLGMSYEMVFDTDSAKAAYEKAIAADPDDEYGASSYASRRLAALNSDAMPSGDAVESTAPVEGLTDTLADKAGVGF